MAIMNDQRKKEKLTHYGYLMSKKNHNEFFR